MQTHVATLFVSIPNPTCLVSSFPLLLLLYRELNADSILSLHHILLFYKIISIRWRSIFCFKSVHNLRKIKCLYCSFRNQNSLFRQQMHNVCLCQSEICTVKFEYRASKTNKFFRTLSLKFACSECSAISYGC